jgi:hypothetical protein
LAWLGCFLQPERVFGRVEVFFIRIGRNPLKSPDSAKEKQGNPSLFAWFYLVLFGFPCFSLEDVRAPSCYPPGFRR